MVTDRGVKPAVSRRLSVEFGSVLFPRFLLLTAALRWWVLTDEQTRALDSSARGGVR